MKTETLEEAAEKFADDCTLVSDAAAYKGFIDGAKWQAERMYNEEDMEEAFTNGLNRSFDSNFDRWFEQFKKK